MLRPLLRTVLRPFVRVLGPRLVVVLALLGARRETRAHTLASRQDTLPSFSIFVGRARK